MGPLLRPICGSAAQRFGLTPPSPILQNHQRHARQHQSVRSEKAPEDARAGQMIMRHKTVWNPLRWIAANVCRFSPISVAGDHALER
jgi:hypothetical protein